MRFALILVAIPLALDPAVGVAEPPGAYGTHEPKPIPFDADGPRGWWCTAIEASGGAESSSCYRDSSTCEDYRTSSTEKGNSTADECSWTKSAACISYRLLLQDVVVSSCYTAFKHCKEYAAFLRREEKDDVRVLSGCKATK